MHAYVVKANGWEVIVHASSFQAAFRAGLAILARPNPKVAGQRRMPPLNSKGRTSLNASATIVKRDIPRDAPLTTWADIHPPKEG